MKLVILDRDGVINFDSDAYIKSPEEWTPIGAIAVGHSDPANDPVPPARASDRKTLDELVHRGRW